MRRREWLWLQLCEEIRGEVPTDEHVLHAMSLLYRSSDRLPDLTAAYVAASAAHPNDVGLLFGVFSSHVRCGAVISHGYGHCTALRCCGSGGWDRSLREREGLGF